MITQDDMRNILRGHCESAGGQGQLAEYIGYSPQYICDVLSGRREVSENLALMIGYKREIVFSACDTSTEDVRE